MNSFDDIDFLFSYAYTYCALKLEKDGFSRQEWGNAVNKITKKLKALEIIRELFDFDFAIRYGNNQPILRITNKLYEKLGKPFYYWELPITQEQADRLKEVLL